MVEVVRASEADESTLRNMLQLYLYEFSEFDGSQISGDGRFEYSHLKKYLGEPERHAFLFKMEGALVGFALVKKGSEIANEDESMDVAEFFVLKTHRRRGVGRAAFGEIVRMFPGPWIVRVLEEYEAARAFWRHTIPHVASSEFASQSIDYGQRKWIVFDFVYADSDGAGSIESSGPTSG